MMATENIAGLLPGDASDHLRVMADAAYKAGAILQAAFLHRDRLRISQKTVGDFVSEADRASEAEISRHLTELYPDYGWLGEETGMRDGKNGSEFRWVVDPLDGTTNFLKGFPHWAISIALCRNDDPIFGLIYDPGKGELFCAEKGKHAHLNGSRIVVSEEANLNAALFATGMPAGGRVTYLKDTLRDIDRLMPHCAGIRRAGAAALDLAYVAAGRFEGYWERNLEPWDIAAGLLLVQEAGGTIERLWPDRSTLQSGSFLASNSLLADDLRACVGRE